MLGMTPPVNNFTPNPSGNLEPVFIEMAELEALRLVDLEGLSQEEAGQRMRISRGTVWRLVQRARKRPLKPSAKEDQYTSFHKLLRTAQNHDAVFTFSRI